VPEREAAGLELRLEVRAVGAGLDRRGVRDLVEVQQPAHARHVDGDDPGLALAAQRGHAADDARAAAEGHDREAVGAGEVDDGLDLVGLAGVDDGVGDLVAEVAGAEAEEVEVALAAGVEGPLVAVLLDVVAADGAGEGQGGGLVEARGRELDLRQRHRGGGFEALAAEGVADPAPDGGLAGAHFEGGVGEAPAVPAQLSPVVGHRGLVQVGQQRKLSAPGSRVKVAGRRPGPSPSTSSSTGAPSSGSATTRRPRSDSTFGSLRCSPR
jgi:hypothetical protein